MAEMTESEAVQWLEQLLRNAPHGSEIWCADEQIGSIIDLIERQAAEIAKLKKEAEAFGLAKKVEEMVQEIVKLKLLCEKKTIENCKVIKQSFREGVGRPEMIDGKCEGYAISDWDDEPHDSCKECIAGMESEEAWLQEMEGRR